MSDQELFNQEQRELQDDDHLAGGRPGLLGAINITWSALKTQLQGLFVWLGDVNQSINGIKSFLKSPTVPDPETDLQAVNLRTLNANAGAKTTGELATESPSEESPNGISTTDKEVNIDLTNNVVNLYNRVSANTEAIANFASASMSVLAPIGTIPEVETRIAWIEEIPSTDTDILDYDTDDYYFELKKQDFRYQLQGVLLAFSTGNGDKTITFRSRLQDDDTLLNEYVDIIEGGNNQYYRIFLGPTFIDNPLEQLDIYITWECSDDEVDVVAGGAFIIGDSVGAGGIVSSFSDAAFSIWNVDDPTKYITFDLSDFATGDVPIIKPQRHDGTLALLDNFDADVRARYLRGINGLLLENYSNAESVGATLVMGENGFVSLKKIEYPETIIQDSSSTDVLLELNTDWYDLGVSITPNFDIESGVGDGIAMCQSTSPDRDVTFSFRVMIDGSTSGNVFTHVVRMGETSLYSYSELLEFPILDGEEVRVEANCTENNYGTILGSSVPTSVRITSLVSVTETPPNIIANQGVGLLSARPATGLTVDDIYVATDTNLKYTATSTTTWDAGIALVANQFVTDSTPVDPLPDVIYQFDGTTLNPTIEYELAIKNDYDATAVPTVTDDETEGWSKGSEQEYAGVIYKCYDATTGAADWQDIQSGGGGGGTIEENEVALPDEDAFNVTSANGETVITNEVGERNTYTPTVKSMNDVDATNQGEGTVLVVGSDNVTREEVDTKYDLRSLNATPIVDIVSDGELTGFLVPGGYKIDEIWAEETTGNSVGDITLTFTTGGASVVAAITVGASASFLLTIVNEVYSRVDDNTLTIASTAWGSGSLDLYVTLIKVG